MIEPSLAAAIARVAERANDVLHGYSAGFEPGFTDVRLRAPSTVPQAGGLSVSAPPDTYFVVRKDAATAFTSDGSFHFEHGELRTSSGSVVLGRRPAQTSGEAAPLKLDLADATVRPPRAARVEADGTVTFMQSSIDPRSGDRTERRVVLGRVALARFPAGTRTVRLDEGHVSAPPSVVPAMGVPGEGGFPPLRPNSRELGRVDLEAALRRLQEAYLSLEALQAAYRGNADLDKGAMDLLK